EDRVLDTELGQYAVGCPLDDLRPGVEVLVYAVSESHQAEGVVLILCLVNPLLDVAAVLSYVLEHHDYLLVGAAGERSPKGVDAGGDGCVDPGPGRADDADGGGGAVLFMVWVRDQQLAARLWRRESHFNARARQGEQHFKEA